MVISKKRVATFALGAALTISAVSFGAFPDQALAWNNCPKGWVSDPYPGACRRYVDTNGDDICDLSQSGPVASTTTTAASSSTATQKSTAATDTAVVAATPGEPPTGDCPLGPCAACGACLSIGSSVSLASSDDDEGAAFATETGSLAAVAAASAATTTTTEPPSGGTAGGASGGSTVSVATATSAEPDQASPFGGYYVSPLALGFFLIYAASFALYKTRRIKVTTHRKIWNVLLLGTFLITGVFGLILTIQLDYTLPFTIPIDLLFWHVEAGVVMTLISLFHVGWHLNYYRNLLRRRKAGVRVASASARTRPLYDEQLAREAREQRWAEREARRGRRLDPGQAPGLAPGPVPDAAPAAAQVSRNAQIVRPYLPTRGRLEPEME